MSESCGDASENENEDGIMNKEERVKAAAEPQVKTSCMQLGEKPLFEQVKMFLRNSESKPAA
ncbi:hypothetical protein [Anaerolentibacter hominis]|uniref:hypothetical protein n=1 Tax=Anaerolentibacter hominis TaxID=3079009 RepID=UPI0031B821FF